MIFWFRSSRLLLYRTSCGILMHLFTVLQYGTVPYGTVNLFFAWRASTQLFESISLAILPYLPVPYRTDTSTVDGRQSNCKTVIRKYGPSTVPVRYGTIVRKDSCPCSFSLFLCVVRYVRYREYSYRYHEHTYVETSVAICWEMILHDFFLHLFFFFF